jgi:DNA repair exonuclease SbcCD ATPase subunit
MSWLPYRDSLLSESNQAMIDEWTTDTEDTMVLLQEEIERLESELRLRDEALAQSARRPSGAGDAEEDHRELLLRVEDLKGELASRDESIALLLEQIRLFEEAESASRAEWEQLSSWVTEVERRVERRDTSSQDLQLELETERNQAAAQRMAFEKDRRAWEAQREALEEEAEHLRAQLAALANHTEAAPDAAYAALESENRRLRDTCHTLVRASAEASDASRLRGQLQAAQQQIDELRKERAQAEDEHERERMEADTAMATLRKELVVASLKAADEAAVTPPGASAAADAAAPPAEAELSVDERIRALRQHLVDIHEREQAERNRKTIGARLSRLWKSTAPGA